MRRHVLVLGGTGEGRALAGELARHTGIRVTSSLAGRVAEPLLPPGKVRVGGFGGVDGLAAWLRDNEVDALVDATHPFAATMTHHAAAAGRLTGTPVVRLARPGWTEVAGDRWHRVATTAQAARMARGLGDRVFLTIGRQEVGAFAEEQGWFLIRAIERPDVMPVHHALLRARGPFTLEDEADLMRQHRIRVLVTKDSGGPATRAKLDAAREHGIPVVMVDRPPLPDGVPVAADVAGALEWLEWLRQSA